MRKNNAVTTGAILLSTLLFVTAASAAPKTRARQAGAAPVSTSEMSNEAGDSKRLGFGLASVEGFTMGSASLLGVLELNTDNALHVYLTLPSTSPFQFSVGSAFKHVVARKDRASVHVGAGLALGTIATTSASADFLLSVAGVVGLELGFPGADNVIIHLDGGPAIQVLDGEADFGIGAFSGLLGLSVAYMF
ncbi:MAG: hypothetical protein A2X94_05670 [Bdellovibrionales bacterium GWB1_55_8]|nr:MAG: hypothetical protein A2X94_05670 [Bdellovibrionales bacterium GWB1_55_8]